MIVSMSTRTWRREVIIVVSRWGRFNDSKYVDKNVAEGSDNCVVSGWGRFNDSKYVDKNVAEGSDNCVV